MDTTDRILVLIDTYKMSIRGFAIKCGIPQQTLDGQLKRKRTVSIETITSIAVTFPEVSRDWLLLGEGEMFKTASLDANSDKIVKLVDTITTLQDTINAKSEQIALLSERIKQLESQLK